MFNVYTHKKKAYQGRGDGVVGGMKVGEEGDNIPVVTLSPPK